MDTVDPLPVYCLLGVLVFAVGLRFILEPLRTAGRLTAYAFLLLFVGLFAAQGLDHSRATYPFVSWTMYSMASFPTDVWEVAAITPAGDTILPNLPMRGMDPRPFHRHIYARATRLERPAADDRRKAEAELIELFTALSRLHVARGGEPFHAVVLTRCPVHDARGLGTPGSPCDRQNGISLALPDGEN